MDHWGEIRKLIETRRADRLAARVRALDDDGRKEVAARLPELLKELRGRFERWDDDLVGYGIALRVAGAAVFGGAAAVASWLYRRDFAPQWAGPDNDVDLILAVIADRPAAWRADLAERLALRIRVPDDRGMALALELLRETGTEPPAHDPLVAGWVGRAPSRLGDDPLLDHLLPRLFEAEGVGRVLQWESEPHAGWLGALLNLAETGRVRREALIEGCVRRFLLGGTAVDLRFFTRLHEALDPSPAEAAPHIRDYLQLLPASPGPVAESAMKLLRACDGLTADDLAEAWEALVFRSERKLVRAGLSWLDRSVRRTPALADAAAAPLARAFAADSAELLEKAVELALSHSGGIGEEGRAAVREAIELLPPHLGQRAATVFTGGTVAEPGPVFTPPPLPAVPGRSRSLEPPIQSVEECARLAAEETSSWQSWERLLAGLVTLAGRDRAGLAAALRPRLLDGPHSWVDWQYRREAWEEAGQWFEGAVRALTATAPVRSAWRRFMPKTNLAAPDLLLVHRAAEVLRAVEEDTLPPLLLATPTHSTGHVAAAELVQRLEAVEAAGAKPLAADLQQALLRLPRTPDPEAAGRAARLTSPAGGILAAWTCPEAGIELEWTCANAGGDHDWHDRSHHHSVHPVPTATAAPTGLPLVDLVLGVPRRWAEERHREWWPSMLPSHREVAAAYLMPYVIRRSRNGPSAGPEPSRDLARAEGPAGAAFAAVLARDLGDPHLPGSVEVLLEAAARGELPAAEIGRQAGLLLASGEVRMTDMIAALDAAARRGAHEHVWRIAAAALPVLLPAPGGRPLNGLAGFVMLAATAAEWSGARGAIPEVRDMAARKGSSGLLREIRRLHERLTAGTGGTENTGGPDNTGGSGQEG
ncbi:hypothetical protein GCM10010156_05970 [Planobispora rosea]|uniref:DUF7824 domain-containing protein n=1 Tax=Planobispora rosea TaxID=35762 RepID=A0A8J3WDH1_PLARO|nr:DUF6493 family protein [Planobispora rosea]GGS50058.1 hypothetical protein GCM10010156_05970 [Planobispora rosea]GIH83881.1 hypothetical protein Pro02_22890 [Planobispora rosea]